MAIWRYEQNKQYAASGKINTTRTAVLTIYCWHYVIKRIILLTSKPTLTIKQYEQYSAGSTAALADMHYNNASRKVLAV